MKISTFRFTLFLFLTSCVNFGSRAYKNLSPLASPEKSRISHLRQKTPPELEALLEKTSLKTEKWWVQYTLAKKTNDKNKACTWMSSLAEDSEFPLKILARINTLDYCELLSAPLVEDDVPSTYKNLYFQSLLKVTQRTPSIDDDFALLKSLILVEKDRRRKEQYLLEALRLAETVSPSDIYDLQMELYKNSPRLNPNPRIEDAITIATDFRTSRDFANAIKYFSKVLSAKSSKPEDKYKAQFEIRQTHKVSGKRTDYLKATEQLLTLAQKNFKSSPTQPLITLQLHDAYILSAKTFWTEGQTEKTLLILDEALNTLKGYHSLAEVYFVQGKVFEEQKLFEKAIESYTNSQNERSIVAELNDQRNWALAWLYYKFNYSSEAAFKFQQIILESKNNSDRNRAQFWLAQIYKNNGQKKESDDLFKNLIEQDPLGYYGLVSYRETGSSIPPIPELSPEERIPLWNSNLETSTILEIDWLIALNEMSLAESLLKKNASQGSSENLLSVLLTFAEAKLYLPLFAEVNKLPPQQKNMILHSHPQLLFPFDYKSLIQSAAEKSSVPKELIFSIIRQESAFNTNARSPMDAFGLMQLLPSVAAKVAQRYNLPYHHPNNLFAPEYNIPIGAFTLKDSFKIFDNQFVLAVASYNAPAWAVQRWAKDRSRENILEFIEEIPYEETRNYVKLVSRNFVVYQRLIHEKPVSWPF